ncbi:hypothetical protein B0H10DRAFT_1951111 [Mycena sp. CBHHK59/15]|nr:hypothetical protein B0H10DRAFT_1951111 [Mycena sp. CBHHK59/15]
MVTITVGLPAELQLSLPHSLNSRLQRMMLDMIRGEEAVDIKLYAFSHRGDGYVSHPRRMFAKAVLLEGHSKSLDALIIGGSVFDELKLVDLDLHDIDDNTCFERYNYMADSDLDSEDEGNGRESATLSLDGSDHIRTPSGSDEEAISEPGTPKLDADFDASSLEPLKDDVPSDLITRSRPASPARRMGRMGRVVFHKGSAFKTWNALLHYFYTGKIRFTDTEPRPSTSEGEHNEVPECSAKSMYRLADELGLEKLKALALLSLNSRLSASNVVSEVFSEFTSLYPELQDIQVEYLVSHYRDLTPDVDQILDSICMGQRPYCRDVLRKIVASGLSRR